MTEYMNTLETSEKIAQRSGLHADLVCEIREIAERCGIGELLLFGSRARGTHHKYSDIDLACRGGNANQFALEVDEETNTALKYDVVDLDRPIREEFRAAIKKDGVVLI